MKKHKTRLEARVAAANLVNTELMRQAVIVQPALLQCIGQVILKNNSWGGLELNKKFAPLFPPLVAVSPNVRVSISFDCHSVYLKASAWQPFDGHIMSFENSYHVAKMDGKMLVELTQLEPIRNDYSADDFVRLRKRAEKLEEDARQAKSDCNPFGLYDR